MASRLTSSPVALSMDTCLRAQLLSPSTDTCDSTVTSEGGGPAPGRDHPPPATGRRRFDGVS